MSKPNQVVSVEGMFIWSDEGANLIGSRCTSCNSYSFPRKLSCPNPNCRNKNVEKAVFSRRGKLYSYTEICYPPPPPFKMPQPFAPYIMGLVELPEGIRVLGMLTGCKMEDLRINMDVETVAEKLIDDEQGNEVITYKFRPLK